MSKLNPVAALVLASIVTVGCAPARVTDNSRYPTQCDFLPYDFKTKP